MSRTIASPGVEIKEYDLSQIAATSVGTNVLLMGYANIGPTDEVLEVTSFDDFENIYGKPTNPAERYFYNSAKQLYNNNANVYVARLPYGDNLGDGFGNNYGALIYPAIGFNLSNDILNIVKQSGYTEVYEDGCSSGWVLDVKTKDGNVLSTFNLGNNLSSLSGANFIQFTAPLHFDLTKDEYQNILNTDWSLSSNAGLIVLNSSQTTINDQYEGYYLGIIDNGNISPGSNYDGILNVNSLNAFTSFDISSNNIYETNYITLPSQRINFQLSSLSNSNVNSISEIMENIPTFDIYSERYNDTLVFGLFKIRKSVFSTDIIKLDYSLQEAYTGSLDFWRYISSSNGGTSNKFFIENIINENSDNIHVLVNPHISNKLGKTWLDVNGIPNKVVRFNNDARALFPVGSYSPTTPTSKEIGNVYSKIERVLSKLEDPELVELDIVVEAGLGTINAYTNSLSTSYFDDTVDIVSKIGTTGGFYNTNLTEFTDPFSQSLLDNYTTICNQLKTFVEDTRKDCIFIADPLRFTAINGANTKILQLSQINGVTPNFTQHVYWPIRYQFNNINSSYTATYGNWAKVYDDNSNEYIWIPFSGIAASIIAYSSDITYPWYAPAGFTRGKVDNVNELALKPNQKQRDQLYKISINPVTTFPNDGMVVFGQKTLLSTPSAFDRINVRRLFLYLERITGKTVKYYVFEPNTYFTRTQVYNALNPTFNTVMQQQGMYDYRIVCSEQNNTSTVIDNNEMVIDIYIQPSRAAEYILVNFYATRTGVNFDEIINS